MRRNNCDEQ